MTSRGRPPPTSPEHPLKILFDRPQDVPIWCPVDIPICLPGDALEWRPGDVLIWRSRDVPGRLIRDVPRTFSGRPLEDQTQTEYSNSDVPAVFVTFLSEVIRLTKCILKHFNIQGVLRTSWNFKDGAFSAKLVNEFLVVHLFCERTSSEKLDWVFNMSLILSSNIVLHAYRLIAEDFQAWCISHMPFIC